MNERSENVALPTETMAERIATRVVEAVCELPDYNSPEDQPDLVMCTVQELNACVLRAFEQLEYDTEMAKGPPAETKLMPCWCPYCGEPHSPAVREQK